MKWLLSLFLNGHLLLGIGPSLKTVFHFISPSNGNISRLWIGEHIFTSPFSYRTLSVADPCWPCECCHSSCEFTCAPDLLCVESLDCLMFFTSSGSYMPSVWPYSEFPEPRREVFVGHICFWIKGPKFPHSIHVVWLGISVFV